MPKTIRAEKSRISRCSGLKNSISPPVALEYGASILLSFGGETDSAESQFVKNPHITH
jgi:hypothetical protein